MMGCASAPCTRLKVHEGWGGCMENRRVPGWGCDLHLVHQIERGGIFARGWEGLSFGSFGTKHKTHLQSLSNILMHFSSKKFIDVKRTFYVQLQMFLVKSKSIKHFFFQKKCYVQDQLASFVQTPARESYKIYRDAPKRYYPSRSK